MAKQIQVDADRTVTQDDAGRWTMQWPAFGLNEKVSEAEVIDMLKRAGQKETIRQHFPMHGFHN